jgi:general secretion pathway protein H
VREVKGFTLIELLITMVLIGIISSVAMLSMGSNDQREWQRQEAERLLQLFHLAAQESIIQGTPVAAEFFSHGYRFMIEKNGKWNADIDDSLFRPRTFHPQLHVKLEVEQQPVFLAAQQNLAAKPDAHIVFTPDSEITLFRIKIGLTDSGTYFTVANTLKNGLLMTTEADTLKP